jgi:hypothetical protein
LDEVEGLAEMPYLEDRDLNCRFWGIAEQLKQLKNGYEHTIEILSQR